MASFTSSFQCLPSSPDHDDIQDSQDFSLRMECSQNSVNSSPELPKEKHPRMAGRSLWQPWPQCESPSLLSGACGGPGDDLTPHRTPQNSSTPLPVQSQTKKALEDLFKKQQDWISDKFKEQEEIIQGLFQDRKRERKSRLEEINVPVQIKQAVRDGYRHNDSDNELRWTTKTEAGVVLKYNSEQNKEMTDAILTFVKGQYPSTEEGVIRHGIDVYFNTIKQKRHMEATGKKESHNRKMVLYSRKHRKLITRQKALREKKLDAATNKTISEALKIEYMSSEESDSEDDSVFTTRPLPWLSSEFNDTMTKLDKKYHRILNAQGKRLKSKRVIGRNSARPRPAIPQGLEWVFLRN